MTIHGIHPTTTITVQDHKTLVQVWGNYGPVAQLLIGSVVVETPLTDRQMRRLPARLWRLLSE